MSAAGTDAGAGAEAVVDALLARQGEVRARLERLIRLPSVSTDPSYAGGMHDAREFLHVGICDVAGPIRARVLDRNGDHARFLVFVERRAAGELSARFLVIPHVICLTQLKSCENAVLNVTAT